MSSAGHCHNSHCTHASSLLIISCHIPSFFCHSRFYSTPSPTRLTNSPQCTAGTHTAKLHSANSLQISLVHTTRQAFIARCHSVRPSVGLSVCCTPIWRGNVDLINSLTWHKHVTLFKFTASCCVQWKCEV